MMVFFFFACNIKKIRQAEEFGIRVESYSFDYSKMVERKDQTVETMRKNLEILIKANNITLFCGFASFISPQEIKISGKEKAIITTKNSIIATGSYPKEIPSFAFDHKKIMSSDSLLSLKTLPKHLVIIGGGVIGCEFASLYHELGVTITILEAMPRLIPSEAPNISSELEKSFISRGINVKTGVMVENIETTKKGINVLMNNSDPIEADMALVAIGRDFNVNDLGLEKAGIIQNANGSIKVNNRMETSVPNIYAIGDVTDVWQLAHVASHQGLVAGDNATGFSKQMHYNAVPSVIFTDPEIGTVGMSLEQAIDNGYAATLTAFPFQALGKSQAALQTDGFAQLVVERHSGQILGAQVIGHDASTLVAEMGVAIANELTIECIAETIHAHPTVAEVWLEAALNANETPMHIPPPKKKRSMIGS